MKGQQNKSSIEKIVRWASSNKVIISAALVLALIALVSIPILLGQGTYQYWRWMEGSWEAVLTGLGTAFVGLTLLFVMFQIRLLIRQLKSSTFSIIQGRIYDIVQASLDHPDLNLFEKLHHTNFSGSPDSPVSLLADLVLAVFEELYCQYHIYQLVDEEIWNGWQSLMSYYVNEYNYFYEYFMDEEQQSHYYQPFVKFLKELRVKKSTSTKGYLYPTL
jgi:hypothetical protein